MTDADRPWERPGVVRRDCEPHRGPLLQGLAWASLGGSAVALGLVVGAFSNSHLVRLVLLAAAGAVVTVTPVLALVARILSGRDIARMRAGLMDPGGEAPAQLARFVSLLGMALGLMAGVAAMGTFGLDFSFWAVAVGSALLFAYVAART